MKQQKQYPCYYKLHLSFNGWDQEIECPHRYRSTNVCVVGVLQMGNKMKKMIQLWLQCESVLFCALMFLMSWNMYRSSQLSFFYPINPSDFPELQVEPIKTWLEPRF